MVDMAADVVATCDGCCTQASGEPLYRKQDSSSEAKYK